MDGLPEISVARAEDRARYVQTAVLAFVADPMARWISDERS